ncbi:MAG: Fe-S cluster assembly protein SufD [Chloroflexota bacterium]
MVVENRAVGMSREAVEQLSSAKNEPEWVLAARLRAWQVFEMLPMPNRQNEDWRRTDIRDLKLNELAPFAGASSTPVQSPLQLGGEFGGTLTHENSVTVDRSLQSQLVDQGVIFTDLDTAVREHPDLIRKYFMTEAVPAEYDKFTALNGAFWSGGTFLYVPRNVDVALPLRALITLTAGGSALFSHTVVVAEEGSRVTYVEEYASTPIDRLSMNAGVVEMFVKQSAHVTFVSLQDWDGRVYDLSTQRALIDRDSTLDWLVIGLGNGLTKANIEAALRGSGASTQMLGLLWGHGKQHTDYHTVQDHLAPHTTSDLLYKSALNDNARSVFSGTIRVLKGAQGTDAYQANRNILLSPHASAFPSPNLEIEANEVRCTHGATIGKVDQDQLFYLMARGIPRPVATRMIIEGFFEDVLQREPVGSIRDNLRELIMQKMDAS